MKDKDNENEQGSINPEYKGGSPLALEAKQIYLKNKSLIESLGRKAIPVDVSTESSLLDESKLKE
jgi:hypothetical protein